MLVRGIATEAAVATAVVVAVVAADVATLAVAIAGVAADAATVAEVDTEAEEVAAEDLKHVTVVEVGAVDVVIKVVEVVVDVAVTEVEASVDVDGCRGGKGVTLAASRSALSRGVGALTGKRGAEGVQNTLGCGFAFLARR